MEKGDLPLETVTIFDPPLTNWVSADVASVTLLRLKGKLGSLVGLVFISRHMPGATSKVSHGILTWRMKKRQ